MGSLVENPKTVIASDNLHLPKIYPGGVPVYDSVDSISNFLVMNKIIFRVSPLILAFVSPTPALSLFFYSSAVYLYYVLFMIFSLSDGNGLDTLSSRQNFFLKLRSLYIRK